ncbi:MAG: transporter, partial [Polyangiaceae bacterium]
TVEDVPLTNPRVQPYTELYSRADTAARSGAVARVVAAARAAGVEGLNLLVEPEIVQEGAEAPKK